MTTAADVLRAGARPVEPYDLNGTKVYLRALAFSDYGPWLKGGEITVTVQSVTKMLTRSLEDEDGQRLFAEKDAKQLGELDPGAVMAMFNKVMTLSSLTAEAQEGAVADFDGAQSGEPFTG